MLAKGSSLMAAGSTLDNRRGVSARGEQRRFCSKETLENFGGVDFARALTSRWQSGQAAGPATARRASRRRRSRACPRRCWPVQMGGGKGRGEGGGGRGVKRVDLDRGEHGSGLETETHPIEQALVGGREGLAGTHCWWWVGDAGSSGWTAARVLATGVGAGGLGGVLGVRWRRGNAARWPSAAGASHAELQADGIGRVLQAARVGQVNAARPRRARPPRTARQISGGGVGWVKGAGAFPGQGRRVCALLLGRGVY